MFDVTAVRAGADTTNMSYCADSLRRAGGISHRQGRPQRRKRNRSSRRVRRASYDQAATVGNNTRASSTRHCVCRKCRGRNPDVLVVYETVPGATKGAGEEELALRIGEPPGMGQRRRFVRGRRPRRSPRRRMLVFALLRSPQAACPWPALARTASFGRWLRPVAKGLSSARDDGPRAKTASRAPRPSG